MSKQRRMLAGRLMSLSEAAQFTPYSAEYLSLRARSGKLEAVKIARNWLTTESAVLNYVNRQAAKHGRENLICQ